MSIKEILKNLDDAGEKGKETKELMETLYLLAEQKADIFSMEIMNSINKGDDRKLPITTLIQQEKEISALAEKDIDNIGKIISNLLDLIVKHDKVTLVEKIKSSIVAALKSFLGTSIAKSDSIDKYYIVIDGYSAVRLDIKCWFHSVKSTSLHEYCEKVFCIVATKSIVDLSKIDISTFIHFYQHQLISSDIKGAELEQEIDHVRKIYDKFNKSMSD